jgi:glycosyltransferase involved in cell wall biosynthesis
MRILFALAGLHRVDRGAEIAFMSVASQLARQGDDVTLVGSGPERAGREYRYIQAPSIRREKFERWPSLPMFRNETAWEEATFVPGLLRAYKPSDFDVTLTCAYPWTSWALRRPMSRNRPKHVFVTQNGDWPAFSDSSEFRWFNCDGLICTNPEYLERNEQRYRATLIPNGVDPARFRPGPAERARLGLPEEGPIVLMVSALITSKNVDEAIRAVALLPGTTLVVAGDGPLRSELETLADQFMPGRYLRVTFPAEDMPALYRSANLFLHLSRDESFGNVFVEAMACGTPIVAYDLPRTRWIVGDEACLAAERSAEAIAVELRRALQPDGNKSGLMKRAQSFQWSSVAAQYRDFLEQVVSDSGP